MKRPENDTSGDFLFPALVIGVPVAFFGFIALAIWLW